MKFATFSGPPSSGKTSVILRTVSEMRKNSARICVLKFDCLATDDGRLYRENGVDCAVGLAGSLCPDHYFVSNIDDCFDWGTRNGYDLMVSESAGLCNRCSPHIQGCLSVCVIDSLMGIGAPKKIGPMLKMADVVVITKGDIVSQAEREIFALKVRQANPRGIVMHVNGITGQGAYRLAALLQQAVAPDTLKGAELRISMPSALCSYCLGETRIGKEKQKGNVRRMSLDQAVTHHERHEDT